MRKTETGHVVKRGWSCAWPGNEYPLHILGNVVGRSARGLLVMAAVGGCSSSVTDGSGHNMP